MDEIKIIHSNDLKISDLPEPYTDWHQFCLFALSWDPKTELEEEQSPFSKKAAKTPTEASTINEIRWHLYILQRGWNHISKEPDNVSLSKIYDAIELLRRKLQQK